MKGLDTADVVRQLEWMIRILLAGVCGGIIGYERESRKKTAGLRTHVIVAVSSALMILLSKYGFQDVVGQYVRVDPSRIASGAVAAIGFLGSGVIFSRNKNISGITTSAGIWATLGVGMAVGAGMYVVGICTTAIVVMVEIFLGRQGKVSHIIKDVYEIEVEYLAASGTGRQISEELKAELEDTYQCHILKFRSRRKGGSIRLELLVRTSKGKELYHLMEYMEKYPEILRINL
ncbi:MAG: MgtC/SapB family protein [Lachnospiraceae bacterium]|nr:MgtC/SapB family protein [Lachnospiraceae bacterium]